ncbi:MAG: HU family DNA-binding protein [Planctomycetota bacterium]
MATTSKKDLVSRIAKRTGAKQVLARAVVQQFFDEVIAELSNGNRLEFRDFGVFETKTSASRTVQNPRTLERVQVPAKRRAVFKAGRLMKEGLNGDGFRDHPEPREDEERRSNAVERELDRTRDFPQAVSR